MNWDKFVEWIRQNRPLAYAIGGLALVLVLWGILRPSGPAAVTRTPGTPAWQVIGFYENATAGSGVPGSGSSFSRHWRQLTTVSPLWFAVTPTGAVSDTGYDAALVAAAHQHHLRVVPLVVNGGGSTAVLWQAATRRRAAAALARIVTADHLDGINLDFELLAPSSRSDLSRFVADVAARLKPLHKIVAVSVFPLVGLPASVNGAYDYHALAQSATYLLIMAYDHHYSGGPPGPVAPWGWVDANIKAALKQAPADRLVLAIGMYGYDWVDRGGAGPANTLSDRQAKALAASHGSLVHYDPSTSQNMFTYTAGGVPHIVYFMGDRSAHARMLLAQRYHLSGIGLWRLGFEDAAFWRAIAQ